MESKNLYNSSENVYSQTPTIEVSLTDQPQNIQTDMSTTEGKKKRVGFTSDTTPPSPVQPGSSTSDQRHHGETVFSPVETHDSPASNLHSVQASSVQLVFDERPRSFHRNDISDHELSREIHRAFGEPYIPKPKPSIRKATQPTYIELGELDAGVFHGENQQKQMSGMDAHDRAQKLAAKVGSYNVSAAASRRNSIEIEEQELPSRSRLPLARPTDENDILDEEHDSDEDVLYRKKIQRLRKSSNAQAHQEASRLVRSYTQYLPIHYDVEDRPLQSGQVTPVEDRYHVEDYVPKPNKYRGGVLASLLKLQGSNRGHDSSASPPNGWRREHYRGISGDTASLSGTTPSHTPGHSLTSSGTSTPTSKHSLLRHWPRRHHDIDTHSLTSISALAGSSSTIALPLKEFGNEVIEKAKAQKKARPGMKRRSRSSDAITSVFKRMSKPRLEDEIRITVHITEIIARQHYLVKLCRALMEYGAPTHRLEEYLKASSRVLEIEAQFLYIPGCMLISFDDPSTHTTEVKLVRTSQGVDLGKLRDAHQIYKDVVHDQIGVEEATSRLDDIMRRPRKFSTWFLIVVYGFAAVSVGPFAFKARLIDLPIAFLLGCLLGFMQIIIAPRSALYANVFEVSAALLTSFFARAFGSIPDGKGGTLFCFSALAQSSIAIILPGYTVLCASLELQSRSIIAGSVRMVYAIIYSLFLGFGITIGTVIYGAMDHNASSATTCSDPMDDYWFFFFVPLFTLCLIIINQAKWKQAPIMLIISFSGYLVNYFTSQRFQGNLQVPQALGALTIGIEANLYARMGRSADTFFINIWENRVRPLLLQIGRKLESSTSSTFHSLVMLEASLPTPIADEDSQNTCYKPRLGYGMAAAAMLPAIFVQVPSGLAVSGSLLSGITSADQITSDTTVATANATSYSSSSAFNVSYSVIEVAIGITVGLFLSAIIVYPFGKRRSGLFSF